MNIKSPFLKAALVAATVFIIHLYFSWDVSTELMTKEEKGRVIGAALVVNLMAFLVTGLLAKFLFKKTGLMGTMVIYLVCWAVFWFISGAGARTENLKVQVSSNPNRLQILGDDLEGEEAKAFDKFTAATLQTHKLGQEAYKATEIVMQDWVLDYSRLINSKEFERQRDVLVDYYQSTKRYQESYLGLEEKVRGIFAGYDPNDDFSSGYLKGFLETKNEKDPLMIPYLEAHVAYGQDMIDLLDLLEENQKAWDWDGRDIIINSDDVFNEYQAIIARMTHHEEAIAQLTSQLE